MSRKIKKYKKFILPGTALLFSLYGSAAFAVGAVIGYACTHLFCKKLVHTGKVKTIFVDCGKWDFHLHHWIIGLFIMLMSYLSQLIYVVPIFWIGFLGGLIIQDIYTDKKWYKVINKKHPA